MKRDVRRSGSNAHASLRHHRFRAPDGYRNARRAGLFCQIEWTLLEGQHASVFRPCAFDEGRDVHTFGKNPACGRDTFLRALFASVAIDGYELALLKSPAKYRDMHQRSFEECARASRNIREQCRRVEVRNVVRHEDARSFRRDEFATLYLNMDARQKVAGPDDHLCCVVEGQNIAGKHRPGNENDRGGNAENNKRAEENQ